jgi:hypothetical protein
MKLNITSTFPLSFNQGGLGFLDNCPSIREFSLIVKKFEYANKWINNAPLRTNQSGKSEGYNVVLKLQKSSHFPQATLLAKKFPAMPEFRY